MPDSPANFCATPPAPRALAAALVAALALLVTGGCASYTDRIREPQLAVSNADAERAVDQLNEQLGVDAPNQRPATLENEQVLLLLERATALQAMGEYELAAQDMIDVDNRLEWFDISDDTADTILRYVYSDDAGPYRAPPHERLLVNSMNMINFLAASNTDGARVEARRFDILQRFFLDDESAQLIPDILGLGNYLAAAAFEASGDLRSAARFYTLAYLYGTWPEPQDERLLDLIATSGWTGSGLGELREDADDLLERADRRSRLSRSEFRDRYQQGDTLFVIQTGMVPYRRAQRVSLAEALTYSERSPYASVHINTETEEEALALYSTGLVTWLNTATLTRNRVPSGRSAVRLSVDGNTYQLRDPIDVGEQVEQAWEMVSATALAAGISRAVARAAAGRVTQELVEAAAEQSDDTAPFAGLLGWLSGLAMQGSLAAADTPDTRSWTSLPDEIHLVRTRLPEGTQRIDARIGGQLDRRQLEVNTNRFQLVNFSRYR